MKDVTLGIKSLIRQQQILTHLGFYNGKIDGRWGPKTIEAKKEYERDPRYKPAVPTYGLPISSKSLAGAINKTKKMNQDINKIRPWLQDFNLGAVYTKDMVKAQMKAVYDSGLKSWMLWDPKNKYTPSALELEVTQ
jgi:peptidoglycan hydrolase-like protein with peptidoglycan-binding domain